MEIALDRLGALVDQLDSAWGIASERLAGLTDEEYRSEPVPGTWSVRRRGDAVGPRPYGPGEWQLDFGPEPDVAPVTTIAWRLAHLTNGLDGRWEWTFGARATDPEELTTFTPSAAEALRQLDASVQRWRAGLITLTAEQLEVPGFGLAEVSLLRDLYRAGRLSGPRLTSA